MLPFKAAITRLINQPNIFFDSIIKRFLFYLPDKLYLSLRFRCQMGYWIDWNNPKTFTEKIQWLKIYNRNPEYTKLVDKFAVKQYVARLIGEEYIIPTLGVWDNFDKINWNSLPDKFVLKTTNGGGNGGVVICKNKSLLNKEKTAEKINNSLSFDIYKNFREWPYRNVNKRIIAERFIQSQDGSDLTDYKFFCFDGNVKFCQVIKDRTSHETIDFFNDKWEHQEFIGLNPQAEHSKENISKPRNYDKMIEIAEKLSSGIPFVRIDLYNINGTIYFGEITFFPASGFGQFSPKQYDYILGKNIVLPEKNIKSYNI